MDTDKFKECCAAIIASAVNPSIEEPNEPYQRPAYKPNPDKVVLFAVETTDKQAEFWNKKLLGMRSTLVDPDFMLGITTEEYWEACRFGKNDMAGIKRLGMKDTRPVKRREMVINPTTEDGFDCEMACSFCGWGTCTSDVCQARSE